MKRFSQIFFRACLLVGWAVLPGARAAEQPASFTEIRDLLKANLVNVDDAKLERAAVEGLLNQLGTQALLVTNGQAPAKVEGPALAKSLVYDNAFGYLRVARVEAGLAKEITSALAGLGRTNKIKGWVLDLRFAGGADYQSAAEVADPFVATEQPLLDWGQGAVRSKAKDNAVKVPVTVLVNRQTAGAAEALAAILRKTEAALLLGTNTAGRAFITKDFPLKTGQQLRIATAPVKIGAGEPLSALGVKPDILVAVNRKDETAYFDDAYKVLSKTAEAGASLAAGTNISTADTNKSRHRINEAELVRMQRAGEEIDDDYLPGRPSESGKPVIRDPVLARALDLLKGLAVVKRDQ